MKMTKPLICPWCHMYFPMRELPPQSAHVVLNTDDGEPLKEYVENPDKVYKTSRAVRHATLSWYYRNREQVLEKARVKRQMAKAVGR